MQTFQYQCDVLGGHGSRDKPCRCVQHILVAMESPATDIYKQRVAVIKFCQNELHYQGNEGVVRDEWLCFSENTKCCITACRHPFFMLIHCQARVQVGPQDFGPSPMNISSVKMQWYCGDKVSLGVSNELYCICFT